LRWSQWVRWCLCLECASGALVLPWRQRMRLRWLHNLAKTPAALSMEGRPAYPGGLNGTTQYLLVRMGRRLPSSVT
jgi:hypothetical protein